MAKSTPTGPIESTRSRTAQVLQKLFSPASGLGPLLMLGGLLLALIWGTVYLESGRARQDRLAKFETNLSHLAEVMEAALARQLDAIDKALMILRHVQVENPSEVPHMIDMLRTGPLKGQDIQIVIVGADGYPKASSLGTKLSGIRLTDRPYFRTFAAGAPDQLLSSDPEILFLGNHVGLPLSRPILGLDGRFQGVALMVLPPREITGFVQALSVGNDTVLTVVSDQGTVLSRSLDLEKHLGTRLTSRILEEYRRSTSGFVIRTSTLDLAERGLAHRWLNGYPLLLVTSSTTEQVLADIQADQQRALWRGALASALVLLSLGFIGWAMLRNRQIDMLLQRQHEHLSLAQHVAKLGSWELDHRSSQLYWSDEVYRIFEQDRETAPATREGFLRAVHPQDRAIVERAFSDALASRSPSNIVLRLQLNDGRIKWVRERFQVELGADAQPLRSFGTVQDITDVKQQADEHESLLRDRLLLLESTGEGIFGIDENGRCTFINQAAGRMLGYAVDEVIDRNIHKLVHYKHADGSPFPASDCPIFHTGHTGESSRTPNDVFWRKDGSPLPVEYSTHPIRDAGHITGTVTVFSDISERLRTESEMRIAATAFESQEGMFVTDEKGTILRINSAFTAITGYSAEDIVGKNPRWRSSGRHDAAFYAAMWARIKTTGTWKGEIWNRRKNGEIYPELITITAVKGVGDVVTNYVATLHDISERKAAEEQILSLAFHDTLTRLPNRRLLQDRLQQAMLSTVRSGHHGAVLFIDLDKFKQLNDSQGHDVGDLLLQQVAQRLLQCVRQTDTVARFGGDEFVVLLEALSTDMSEAHLEVRALGAKIVGELNRPYDLNGYTHHSTPSIGATLFSGHEHSSDELLRQADLAMYQTKATGRNGLSFFDPSMLEGQGSRFSGLT